MPVYGAKVHFKAMAYYRTMPRGYSISTTRMMPQDSRHLRWWLKLFKKCHNLHKWSLTEESASADSRAASRYSSYFQKHVSDGGYSPQYNCDDSGLLWCSLVTHACCWTAIPS
ncbi:Jerky protein-like 2 [Homarus americanus]|uniref:Jerky protein-like 2 n=1 Tax=Homarus americanus TaxID=6706 RepID=A0A8J5MV65_HOMAM|nr:Jerky protein-like 2 [Homarus americanus]